MPAKDYPDHMTLFGTAKAKIRPKACLAAEAISV